MATKRKKAANPYLRADLREVRIKFYCQNMKRELEKVITNADFIVDEYENEYIISVGFVCLCDNYHIVMDLAKVRHSNWYEN